MEESVLTTRIQHRYEAQAFVVVRTISVSFVQVMVQRGTRNGKKREREEKEKDSLSQQT